MNTNILGELQIYISVPLTLDLKLFRSQVRERHSTGREFQSLPVRGNCLHRHPYKIYEWSLKNHANYQNNEWISHRNKETEPAQPVQMNIYQSNTYRKDLSQLHFYDGPRIQERQQLLDHVNYLSQNATKIYFKTRQVFSYKMRQFYNKMRQLSQYAIILL